jgi:hypothetical protein
VALRKQAAPATTEPMVPVREVAIAARPEYGFAGLPSLTAELVEMARALGLDVVTDTIARPCLSPSDAGRLYSELVAPRPVPADPPRPRAHVPGVTFADPAITRPVEVH